MKNNVTDSLNDILNVETELVDVEKPALMPTVIEHDEKREESGDINSDYNFARDNLYDVIAKSSTALDYLLELAKASEHPRAFEVVSTLTKTLVDANKDLLEIQKKVKDLKKDDPTQSSNASVQATNALFVGSTADLQKLIKGEDGTED